MWAHPRARVLFDTFFSAFSLRSLENLYSKIGMVWASGFASPASILPCFIIAIQFSYWETNLLLDRVLVRLVINEQGTTHKVDALRKADFFSLRICILMYTC